MSEGRLIFFSLCASFGHSGRLFFDCFWTIFFFWLFEVSIFLIKITEKCLCQFMFKSCHWFCQSTFLFSSSQNMSFDCVYTKKESFFQWFLFLQYILYYIYYIYRNFFIYFFQVFQGFQRFASDKLSHLNGQTFTPSFFIFMYYILILNPSEYSSKSLMYLSLLYVWRIVLSCSIYLFFFFWSDSCFIWLSFSVSIKEKIVSNFISSM